MFTIIASEDRYLGEKLAQLVRDTGNRSIRSADLERITLELKKPSVLVIIDAAWEAIQTTGTLKRLVNVGRITGSKIVCVCPNTDEKLKKLASSSGCDRWFLRYDLDTLVRDYLRDASATRKAG